MNVKKFLLTIITYIIISFTGYYINAQDSEPVPTYDTSYIESFRDYMVITLVTVRNTNNVSVNDNYGNDIVFSTNLPFYFGLALDYKWLTFEYTSSFNKQGDISMGKTDSKSIGFGITGRKFWFRNFWKKYQGYYMSNPGYYNPNFDPKLDNYMLRPDLKTLIYFANLNYGFNYRKYSNTASLWQLEKQKKSAGSFTTGLSFAYINYAADSSLIIPEWEENFNKNALIKEFNLLVFGINGGYLHTFSMFKRHRLFLSLALIPGLSYQTGIATHESNEELPQKNMIGAQTEMRIVLGYNHKRWYTSLSTIGYYITNNFSEENPINQDYTFFRFMLGYKIKMPETKSKLLKKIGL